MGKPCKKRKLINNIDEVKVVLKELAIGERIKIGDYWLSWTGDLIKRDSVKMFESLTFDHTTHYRVENLIRVDKKI